MKRLSIYASALFLSLAFYSCDKDGTVIESEMSEDHPIPTTDYTAIGFKYGESFASGVLEVKDTVASAYASAEKGFPYDSLTFCKMLTPALAACQWSYEKYMQAAEADSIFGDWESGFLDGCSKKANIDKLTISSLLNKYKEVDMANVSDKANIQKAFDISKLIGGKQAKLVNQKVL
ncbi:MAG: hypothetical protein MJZ33_13390 [Paludibacteraceae bacterium]|nr:hypothetical protein [Paludibacteraceae bacterium]